MGVDYINKSKVLQGTLQKNKKPFRKICQTKNLPDSDPDLTSSSLVTFGPNFDCISHPKFYMKTYVECKIIPTSMGNIYFKQLHPYFVTIHP